MRTTVIQPTPRSGPTATTTDTATIRSVPTATVALRSPATARWDCWVPDQDGDGYADQTDDLPLEPTQWDDLDGDGYGDSMLGVDYDEFKFDPTQQTDRDGTGTETTSEAPGAMPVPIPSERQR